MLCMLGSNGKRVRQRERKKSERERARKEWERERRSLPHRFKKVRVEEGESLFYGKQKRKTSPEKQDKFFFGFQLTNLSFLLTHIF
jgi:hypothetical protein